jgi:hypothetical protein
MNKARFFKHCNAHQGKPEDLRVSWRGIYRDLERAVFLEGSWANGAIQDVQLYQPTPGRQGQERTGGYLAADRACEAAVPKFQRWLDEWRASK